MQINATFNASDCMKSANNCKEEKKMNHKENILKEYLNFNLDEKTRDKFIKKYDFDYYVIGSMNLDLVNYLLNYDYIKYDLVFANEEIFLIKKVS